MKPPKPVQDLVETWGDNSELPECSPDGFVWTIKGYLDYAHITSDEDIAEFSKEAEAIGAVTELEYDDCGVEVIATYVVPITVTKTAFPIRETNFPLRAITFFVDNVEDGKIQVRFHHITHDTYKYQYNNYWITIRQMQLLIFRLTLLGYKVNKYHSKPQGGRMVLHCPLGKRAIAQAEYQLYNLKRVVEILSTNHLVYYQKAYDLFIYAMRNPLIQDLPEQLQDDLIMASGKAYAKLIMSRFDDQVRSKRKLLEYVNNFLGGSNE